MDRSHQPAVLLGVDGISDFNGLHSRKHDNEVMFYAFDILDGDLPSRVPSEMRFVKNLVVCVEQCCHRRCTASIATDRLLSTRHLNDIDFDCRKISGKILDVRVR